MRFLLANNLCVSDTSLGEIHSLRTIMRWLARAGHDCHILTTARSGSRGTRTVEEHLRQLGVPVTNSSTVRYQLDGIPVTLLVTHNDDESETDGAESAQYLTLFSQLLTEFAPGHVIACNGHPMIRAAMATARARGITTIFTLRGPGYYDRRYFDGVDHVFTTSQYITDLHHEEIGLISTPLDSPIDWADVVAPKESRAFVTFVHPAPHKGLMLFARLAGMLGARRPDIPVLIIQSCESAGALNGIPGIDFTRYPQIMAAPAVPTPAEYFALTRILLVPSLIEAFGRVAAEAMINAIPSIVSDRGNLPRVIGGDFSTGGGGRVLPVPEWLTPETLELPTELEIEPWFDAVCELWDDDELYQRVAARAFQLAEERYSEEASCRRYLNYLTSLKPGGRVFD